MEKRRGMNLSTKMILTTSALILGIVALFGWLNAAQSVKIFDESAARLRESTFENLRGRGAVQTRSLGESARSPILGSDYATLQSNFPKLAGKDDPLVAFAFIADKDGLVLAHTDAAQNSKKPSDAVALALLGKPEPEGRTFEDVRLLGFSAPIEHEGQRVGTAVLALRLGPLDEQIKKIEAQKAQSMSSASLRTILLGAMFILFGSAIAVFQGMRISGPLQRLNATAGRIAQGDLSQLVEVTSSDEVGQLGESFNFMANQLVIFLEETRQKAVLEKELEIARTIQETLVPPSDVIERNGVKVCGYFQPSSQLGGDWWTQNDLPGDRLLVVIGDVTGHGTGSAMITAAAKAACDTIRLLAGDKLTVTQVLEVLNRAIYESARRRFVMTCFAAIIDTRSKTITFANAGHNFPYLFRARTDKTDPGLGTNPGTNPGGMPGGSEPQELQVLMSRGNPLGDVPDSTYTEKTQIIEPNDVLVWYTDGIVECENANGEQFGEKRFRAAIKAASNLEPARMRDKVLGLANDFFGDTPRKDDITMIFAKVKP